MSFGEQLSALLLPDENRGTFLESISDCCVIFSSIGPLPEPVVNGQTEEKVRQIAQVTRGHDWFENRTFSQKKTLLQRPLPSSMIWPPLPVSNDNSSLVLLFLHTAFKNMNNPPPLFFCFLYTSEN